MCRLFGISVAPHRVRATFWLLEAPDSLAVQGRREPDGTGLGTFGEDGAPLVEKQPLSWVTTGTSAGDTDSERFFALITKNIDAQGGDVGTGIAAGRGGSPPRSRSTPASLHARRAGDEAPLAAPAQGAGHGHGQADRPNIVMGINVQVCWDKFANYWDIDARLVPMTGDRFHLTAQEAAEQCDENTIGVVAVLGSTFNGSCEPMTQICSALDGLQQDEELWQNADAPGRPDRPLVVGALCQAARMDHRPLPPGVYDRLLTHRLQALLDGLPEHLSAALDRVDPAEEPGLVTRHVADVLRRVLEAAPDRADRDRLTAAVIAALQWPAAGPLDDERPVPPPRVLRVVTPAEEGPGRVRMAPPVLGVGQSDLLVNARGEPNLLHSLISEIASADRIDVIVAFIKFSGLRPLLEAFGAAARRGAPIRVITTTYLGAPTTALDPLVRDSAPR